MSYLSIEVSRKIVLFRAMDHGYFFMNCSQNYLVTFKIIKLNFLTWNAQNKHENRRKMHLFYTDHC